MTDPDMGAWTYEYDPLGTLKSQTDAKGQRIDFFDDALGRPVRSWYPAAWTTPSTGIPSKPSVYDLMELRCAVDTNRRAAGLAAYSWTNAEIVAGKDVKVRAVHFTDLKGAL